MRGTVPWNNVSRLRKGKGGTERQEPTIFPTSGVKRMETSASQEPRIGAPAEPVVYSLGRNRLR